MNSTGGGRLEGGSTEQVLERLVREVPADRPEYIADLRRLFDLIRAGGPENCSSSLIFAYLRGIHPREYEALKDSWVSDGGTLHEGFEHFSLPDTQDARLLDPGEDVVFCVDGEEYGMEGFHFFTHEADALLMALGSALQDGSIELSAALEAWRPYRKWCEQLYDPPATDSERLMLMTGGGVFVPMPDSLELFTEADQYTPATARFELYAEDLDIADVGWDWNMGNPIFSVSSVEGLEALSEEARGRYRIVSRADLDDYIKSTPQAARTEIERTLLTREAR